jgi:DNA replication protein DnaC
MPRRKPPKPPPDEVIERLRGYLQFLGLTHTLKNLQEHLDWAARQKPSHTDLFEHVLAQEVAVKTEHRIERRIRLSGLKERKTLEAFDWAFQTGVDKSHILQVGRLDWVPQAEDLLITGKSGTGKSHFLKAFTLRACQQQYSVRYARCVDLMDDLYAGLADDTYPLRLKRWCAPALLVIDDVGLGQVRKRDNEPTAAHTLFNIIDRRHTHLSTALSSNIKLSQWGRYLGDATLAAAVLDRLAMRAIRIDIDGPSYRQHIARKRAKVQQGKAENDDASKPKPRAKTKT